LLVVILVKTTKPLAFLVRRSLLAFLVRLSLLAFLVRRSFAAGAGPG